MVKNTSFSNTAFVLLTNLFCILEFCWHFEMKMNLNIFITTVKAFLKKILKKDSKMCVCVSVCV